MIDFEGLGRVQVVLAAAILSFTLACGQLPDSRELPPNIVLIVGDDHGYGDFGFMGSDVARTPNLDELAKQGTLFTHGYSTSSVCKPALMSLLTGLYPHQWVHLHRQPRGIGAETEAGWDRRPFRLLGFESLPRLLSQHGYATFRAGKLWEPFTKEFTDSTELLRGLLDPVVEFISARHSEPFFLWYAPMLPHLPHDAPAKYRDVYAGSGAGPQELGYYANVSWFDDEVGQLLDHLESTGLRGSTLIVYVVDNGWVIPSDASVASGFGGPKGKGTLHDAGFRTPLLFSWPGLIPEGVVRDDLVSIVDILPTLMEYAEIHTPSRLPGRSLVPMIEGAVEGERDVIVGSLDGFEKKPGRFLRSRRWHYIERPGESPRLYDVIEDPGEAVDLAESLPVLVRLFGDKAQSDIARDQRDLTSDTPRHDSLAPSRAP